jgi:hypothetical protein
MEAVCSSETKVDFYQTTWHRIPEDSNVQSQRYENPKSNIIFCYMEYYTKVNMAANFLIPTN